MQSNITLAMIVLPTAEEAKKLDRALTSVKGAVDEIVITQAGEKPCKEVEAVAKKHKAKCDFFAWTDDFAAARTHSFAQATGDWILWMDADDILVGGDKLRKYLTLAEERSIDGFAFLYHYGYDANRNLIEKHWKTQMVRNDGHAEWVGAIHEDLLPKRSVNWVSIHDVYRIHKANKEENADHFDRNLRILLQQVEKNPQEPRNYFYLARTYLGLGRHADAISACLSYLERSGWDQERYEARLIMGEAFMRLGDSQAALEAYQAAILEFEGAPDAYIYKARIYVIEERWKEALTNLEIAGGLKATGVVVENPALLKKDLPSLAALCLINLKRFEEARKMAKLAVQGGKSPEAEELLKTAEKLAEWENLTVSYASLARHHFERDEPLKVKALLENAPSEIVDDPRLLKLQFAVYPPTVWPYRSIAFFCGQTVEPWDGNSAKNGGIGGSETAVIELAKQFVADGWKVTVYNWCNAPAEGTVIDGVLYKNYWQLDRRDTFDVLCLWRVPGYLDVDWKARKLIVDLHDTGNPADWTPKRIAKVDHIFVKSNYHRSLYPSVPDEKFVVVGNGINTDRFEGWDVPFNKNRFVYTSTQNRGLETLLDLWPEIKKRIPEAELHVYYGWETFYKVHKSEPVMMDWMRTIQEKMQQPGIVDHGRVGQEELAKDLLSSAMWLYPTEFPEVHCITALEMQAAGVYPITSGFAALAETQKGGVKIPGDPKTPEWRKQFVDEVVKAYRAPELDVQTGRKFALSCSWENVANIWKNLLK